MAVSVLFLTQRSVGDKDSRRYIQVQIRQLIPATLIVSVSLVLFLLGILGMVLINARQLSDYFRESLSFTIMLKEDAREADIKMLQKELDAKTLCQADGVCLQR